MTHVTPDVGHILGPPCVEGTAGCGRRASPLIDITWRHHREHHQLHRDRPGTVGSAGDLDPRHPARGPHPRPAVRRGVPRLHRRLDRQRGTPLDPRRPGLHGAGPAVGAQRLPAHLRRLHAAGRASRRPSWPPSSPRRGNRGLRPVLARRWSGHRALDARRRPARAGSRCRDDVAGRPVTSHDDVPGRPGPEPRAGRVGRCCRARLRRRSPARRPAHRRAGMALGAVREPADLRAAAGGDVRDHPARRAAPEVCRLRPHRLGARHGRHAAAGVRPDQGPVTGMGFGTDDR